MDLEGTGNKLILVAVDNIDISILSVVEKETIFGANKATESKRPKKAHKRSLQRNIYAVRTAIVSSVVFRRHGKGREGKERKGAVFHFSVRPSTGWLVGWGGDW
jgi:hypothetical protein